MEAQASEFNENSGSNRISCLLRNTAGPQQNCTKFARCTKFTALPVTPARSVDPLVFRLGEGGPGSGVAFRRDPGSIGCGGNAGFGALGASAWNREDGKPPGLPGSRNRDRLEKLPRPTQSPIPSLLQRVVPDASARPRRGRNSNFSSIPPRHQPTQKTTRATRPTRTNARAPRSPKPDPLTQADRRGRPEASGTTRCSNPSRGPITPSGQEVPAWTHRLNPSRSPITPADRKSAPAVAQPGFADLRRKSAVGTVSCHISAQLTSYDGGTGNASRRKIRTFILWHT